jgi:hypothetical protein
MKQPQIFNVVKRELPNSNSTFEVFFSRNCIVIEKKEITNKLIKEIGVVIDENSTVKNFYSLITILEVEKIMTPILQKNRLFGNNDNGVMLTSTFQQLEPELFQKTLNPSYPKTIESEADVIGLLDDLNEYTENVAEPFFEKWSDLRVLNDFIETVPQMEISNYLGGYGASSKAVIYKLCNNPKFDEYFNWIYNGLVNRYINNPNGDISYKQQHDLMIDLKEVLDRTDAIYNV